MLNGYHVFKKWKFMLGRGTTITKLACSGAVGGGGVPMCLVGLIWLFYARTHNT